MQASGGTSEASRISSLTSASLTLPWTHMTVSIGVWLLRNPRRRLTRVMKLSIGLRRPY